MTLPTSAFPPSDPLIIQVIRAQQANIIAGDVATLNRMADQWIQIERTLAAQVAQLAYEITDKAKSGEAVTRAEILRLQRYKELAAAATRETDKYVDYANRTVTDRQRTLIAQGLSDAVESTRYAYQSFGLDYPAFNLLPKDALNAIVGMAGDGSPLNTLLSEIGDLALVGMTDALVDGIALGLPPMATAKRMADGFAVGLERAFTIARTETLRAYRFASQEQYKAGGVVIEYMRIAQHTPTTCAGCLFAEGEVFPVDRDFDAHPNCILPGNEVIVPGTVDAATKSFYNGPAVEISIRNGSRITVTENHPILTDTGWKPAGLINERDYLGYSGFPQRIASAVNPNDEHVPTAIENIFSSLSKSIFMTPVRVPSSAKYFHGDGRYIDGDINIVKSDGLLLSGRKRTGEPIGQHAFNRRDICQVLLFPKSLSYLCPSGFCLSAYGNVSSFDLAPSLLRRHPIPFHPLALGLRAERNAVLGKQSTDNATTDTSLARKFVHRYAGNISFDPVIRVRKFNFSGHVFDLQSREYGLYFCNNIITHNCRCSTIPVVDGAPRPQFETGEDWFLRQPEDIQRKILGPGKYDAWQRGVPLKNMSRRVDNDVWGGAFVPARVGDLEIP